MPMDETCFVITPIGRPNSPQRRRADRLCDQIINPALAKLDKPLALIRGDRMQEQGSITVQIIEAIVAAKLVFADLIDPNPNVYYELGVAESFDKPIIRFGGSDEEALPFDVRDMRTITIPANQDGAIDVIDAVSAVKSIDALLPAMLALEY